MNIIVPRTKGNSEKYKQRQSIAEHPFGTIKEQWDFTTFLQDALKM